MKNLLIIFFFFSFLLKSNAQKEDYIWIMGKDLPPNGDMLTGFLDFNSSPFGFETKSLDTGFSGTVAVISNSEGNLVCFSNGVHIYNSNFEIIENGDEFYSSTTYAGGFVSHQGALLLPFPNHPNQYVFFLGNVIFFNGLDGFLTNGYNPLTYSILDMEENNGEGLVTEREIPIIADTLHTAISATRHANGRDWWIINPKHLENKFYRTLLSPEGVILDGIQEIGTYTMPGLGQSAFSPDGNWYARYNWSGNTTTTTHVIIDIFRFDRCTGMLSDPIKIVYEDEGRPGGVSFSPNSRFLYVSAWSEIFQFDLEADSIPDSRITVAEYDGFTDSLGFATRFYLMQLAPDNRIYTIVSGINSEYLHVIDQPDSLGVACNVLQHHIKLPVRNSFSIPNMPNFRLGALEGSPCDSIISSVETPKEVLDEIKIYPNPTENILHLDFPYPLKEVAQFTLFDNIGQAVFGKKIKRGEVSQTFYLEELPKGIYFYKIETDERKWQSGKVLVF